MAISAQYARAREDASRRGVFGRRKGRVAVSVFVSQQGVIGLSPQLDPSVLELLLPIGLIWKARLDLSVRDDTMPCNRRCEAPITVDLAEVQELCGGAVQRHKSELQAARVMAGQFDLGEVRAVDARDHKGSFLCGRIQDPLRTAK